MGPARVGNTTYLFLPISLHTIPFPFLLTKIQAVFLSFLFHLHTVCFSHPIHTYIHTYILPSNHVALFFSSPSSFPVSTPPSSTYRSKYSLSNHVFNPSFHSRSIFFLTRLFVRESFSSFSRSFPTSAPGKVLLPGALAVDFTLEIAVFCVVALA